MSHEIRFIDFERTDNYTVVYRAMIDGVSEVFFEEKEGIDVKTLTNAAMAAYDRMNAETGSDYAISALSVETNPALYEKIILGYN